MTPSTLRLAAVLAGAACVLAGLYLLTSQTADPDSYLQILGRGLGLYMVGKGLFVGALLYAHAAVLEERESPPPTTEGGGRKTTGPEAV